VPRPGAPHAGGHDIGAVAAEQHLHLLTRILRRALDRTGDGRRTALDPDVEHSLEIHGVELLLDGRYRLYVVKVHQQRTVAILGDRERRRRGGAAEGEHQAGRDSGQPQRAARNDARSRRPATR
jgi:hypothetical protein